MKTTWFAVLVMAALVGAACSSSSGADEESDSPTALGEAFVDAFVAFDEDALAGLAAPGTDLAKVLYHMRFVEALSFEELGRSCTVEASFVTCMVEAQDDATLAMGYTYEETFSIVDDGGKVGAASVSNGNPEVWAAFLEWWRSDEPAAFAEGACKDFYAAAGNPNFTLEGTTPSECGTAGGTAAAEFVTSDSFEAP